jgi:hypothetical protein
MAAVHRQVQRYHGEISVSTRRGTGTCWRFAFPLSALDPYEAATAAAHRPALVV